MKCYNDGIKLVREIDIMEVKSEYTVLEKEIIFPKDSSFVYEEKNEAKSKMMHTHTFFEIFLTISDQYRHFVNGTEFILPVHSLVFVRDRDMHKNVFPDITQHYFQLLIAKNEIVALFEYLNNSVLKETLLNALFPPTVQLNPYDFKKTIKLFDGINLLNANNHDEVNLYCKKVLICLFTDYFTNFVSSPDKKPPAWLDNTLEIINAQKLFIGGIDKLVELSGKSYEHLSRCMKEYFDTTPSEYINDLRLNYAANLCRNTRQPITDICYSCGFNNISYFYSLFNKKYSCTPLELRKRYSIE